MKLWIRLSVGALIGLAVSGSSYAASSAREAELSGWLQTRSDIKADPLVRFGQLPNGLRYAIQKNATPKSQVAMRLRVASGSLQEADDQQGLAHYLEHMAFRGSKTVPDGEVWKSLERLGLTMGADTNAFTAQTQTVYQFDLARNDDESVDTGLTMLRDIASGLSLDEKAFAGERGVVLSEMRLRDGPANRVEEDYQAFLLPGQLASRRPPIGQRKILETAEVEAVRRYYCDWYRPERLTLIVTGDVNVKTMEAKIRQRFADWRNLSPPPVEPDLGVPSVRQAQARVHTEMGAPSMTLISWVQAPDRQKDSRAREYRDVVRQIGLGIFNRRLQEAAAAGGHHFTRGEIGEHREANSADVVTLEILHEPSAWHEALVDAELLKRQMVEAGVQQSELDRQITAMRSGFKVAAAGATTRLTPALADALVESVEIDDVYTSPAQDVALTESIFKTVTREQVHKALRDLFSGAGPLIFVSTPQGIEGGEPQILKALNEADAQPLTPSVESALAQWPYEQFGAPGQILEKRYVADLDLTQVRFANGVALNIKATRFSADQVLVHVALAGGRRVLPADKPSLNWGAGVLVKGGTGSLDYPAIQRVLAGKNYSVSFQMDDASWVLGGQTTRADLVTQLQVLTAYLTDPGWRPEAFAQQISGFRESLAQLDSIPMAVLQTQAPWLLHDRDSRWAFPDVEQVNQLRLEDLKNLINPVLASAPMEVSIVGDVNVDTVIQSVASTLGALPSRPPVTSPLKTTPVKFPSSAAAMTVLHHRGAADQGVAAIAFPTTDSFSGLPMSGARQILADIIQQRLFDTVRVQAGASYSTQMMSQTSPVFAGYGELLALVDIPAEKAPVFFEAIRSISTDLQEHGPTVDEMNRARNPAVAKIIQAQQSNGYWLAAISQLQTDPRHGDLIRQVLPHLKEVTADQVKQAARTYLNESKAARILVAPLAQP